MKMSSTFGAWMMDTATRDDEKIWVAEHFSGTEERTNTENLQLLKSMTPFTPICAF